MGSLAYLTRGSFLLRCALLIVVVFTIISFLSFTPYKLESELEISKRPVPIAEISNILFRPTSEKGGPPWIDKNHHSLRSLFRCIETGSCSPNQKKVVLLADSHYSDVLWDPVHRSGERIWANSTINALENLGYTPIYTSGVERTVLIYHMLQDLVTAVFFGYLEIDACYKANDFCVRSETNPAGIPAWKIFTIHFWWGAANPLGKAWTLNPEDYKGERGGNTYLGYSVESMCKSQPLIPPSERERRAYLLAKLPRFFELGDHRWPPEFFEEAAKATGISYVAGFHKDPTPSTPVFPENLVDLGFQDRLIFLKNVAMSQILIGIGEPKTPPTPYEALCMGVPFLNPIRGWSHENRHDRNQWEAQHDALKWLDPPYVYNVFLDDREGFVKAIRDAQANPIERFIPEWATESALEARLDAILKTDWRAKAIDLLDERKKSGSGPLFTI